MNSELIVKMEELLKSNKEKIESLKKEYYELTSLDHDQTKEDLSRIKVIREELTSLNDETKELDSDLTTYTNLNINIDKLTKLINKTKDEGVKFLIEEKKEELVLQRDNLVNEEFTTKYGYLLEENKEQTNNEEEEPTKSKLVSLVALLAALGIGLSVGGILSNKDTKETSIDNNTEITEIDNAYQEGFTNITDNDSVMERAYEIKTLIDSKVPNNDYTTEEIESILKWINGGVVDEVSEESALFAITRVENLMNKENNEEIDAINYSMFFLDNSEGYKLANKIYNSKNNLKESKGKDNFKTNAEEFTKLFVNSWYLNGTNNEISSYALETSGMEALIDKYFLNTYAYIDIPVEVEVNNSKFNLDEVATNVNKATCPATVTATNGETFDTYVNKFTSDMIGMVTEASYNKENSYSLTLN